jgi:hypothetical protein
MMRWVAAAIAMLAIHATPAAAQSWTPKNGDRLVFDVFRDGARFGTHVVSFVREGETLIVDSDIELKVTLGLLTLFHYVHDATERYVADTLVSVSARTKSDGRWKTVRAKAVEGGLQVTGAGFDGLVTGVTIPSTHWNISQMKQSAMLSTETGAMLPMTVTDTGVEQVKVGSGEIEARRYVVRSELVAAFWYDAEGRWVKCAFEAQGSRVDYVLRQLPG